MGGKEGTDVYFVLAGLFYEFLLILSLNLFSKEQNWGKSDGGIGVLLLGVNLPELQPYIDHMLCYAPTHADHCWCIAYRAEQHTKEWSVQVCVLPEGEAGCRQPVR